MIADIPLAMRFPEGSLAYGSLLRTETAEIVGYMKEAGHTYRFSISVGGILRRVVHFLFPNLGTFPQMVSRSGPLTYAIVYPYYVLFWRSFEATPDVATSSMAYCPRVNSFPFLSRWLR